MGGAACMMPSNIKKICSFFKKTKRARKIFIVFITLSGLSKISNRAVTHTYMSDIYARATNAIQHFVHSSWQL